MRILIVKTSSLGDVIHNLPVISDLKKHLPQAEIDWCVEDSFAAIPRLHPGVGQIIPVAIRRWRKHLFKAQTWREISAFRVAVQAKSYDLVLDTQGLVKSALLARRARGPLAGYAADSAREPLASSLYTRRYSVARDLHAVVRNRQLAAAAFDYLAEAAPDYGIAVPAATFDWLPAKPYVVFLSATSRDDKLWPQAHWIALGKRLLAAGWQVALPQGSEGEQTRAEMIAAALQFERRMQVEVWPTLRLDAASAPSISLPSSA